MATMDITPQELRDIEIREAWRGYHRDDVDELLERAAATIEHLEAELRSRSGAGGGQRTPPPRAAAPVPAAAPPPAATPMRIPDTDVIQRTLLLAQKAADEAVAEAKERASQIVTTSESRAAQIVAEAETAARRIAEQEKSRLEAEVTQLTLARDTLTADVDALAQFEADYKERLQRAIETELATLSEMRSLAGQRPALHPVDLPARASASTADESWSASQETVVVTAATPEAERGDGRPPVRIEAPPAADAGSEQAWDPTPAGGWGDPPARVATAHVVDDSLEMEAPGRGRDSGPEGDGLDDDAFFASLREAVRDEAPLGAAHDDDPRFFDEDTTDQHDRSLFKRRR